MIQKLLNLAVSAVAIGGTYALILGIIFYRGFFGALHFASFDLLSIEDYLAVMANVVFGGIVLAAAVAILQVLFSVMIQFSVGTTQPAVERLWSFLQRVEKLRTPVWIKISAVVIFVLLAGFWFWIQIPTLPRPFALPTTAPRDYVPYILLAPTALLVVIFAWLYACVFDTALDRRAALLVFMAIMPPISVYSYGMELALMRTSSSNDNVRIRLENMSGAETYVLLANLQRGLLVYDRSSKAIDLIRWERVQRLQVLPSD